MNSAYCLCTRQCTLLSGARLMVSRLRLVYTTMNAMSISVAQGMVSKPGKGYT